MPSKDPRIVDKVPVPIRPTYESWRLWCLRVADELADMFQEYQRPTLESEALYSAAATAVYQMPSGCAGDIEDITFFDMLYRSLELLGVETYLRLARRTSAMFRYAPALVEKWRTGLASSRITPDTWASAVGVDERELRYWAECGLHLRPATRALIDAWLEVRAPWPIPGELLSYMNTLKQEK